MPLSRTCRISGTSFEVTDRELTFLEKISPSFGGKKYLIPPPTLCPDERLRRRISWRNMYALYKTKCALTGKDIISLYAPNRGYKGTDQKTWWEEVECLDYGKEFREDIPFFDQYDELIHTTPVPSLSNAYTGNVNSDFVQGTINVKDCYLIFNSTNDEKCAYSETANRSNNIMDSSFLFDSSYCYENIGVTNCYECIYLEESDDCHDIFFSYDCRGCDHCILSYGLENQSYMIANTKVTKEEYETFIKKHTLSDGVTLDIERLFPRFEAMKKSAPKNSHIIGSENCTGSFIKFSHNIVDGKNLMGMEDSMYVRQMNYSRDCHDCFSWGGGSAEKAGAENCYECMGVGTSASNLMGCWAVWENTSKMYYSYSCISCQDCFGCVGLRNKRYCILNKQYTKEEYEALVGEIIEKMIADKEWGEYPPTSMSCFAYNETIANLDFPLTREEALEKGYEWNDYENPLAKVEKIIGAEKLPREISKIPDDVLNWAILCEASGRPFIMTRMELDFYRKIGLPIPRLHPDERRRRRHARRVGGDSFAKTENMS